MQHINLFKFVKSYLLITVLLLSQSLFAQQTNWQWGIWGNTNCSNAEPGACTNWELSDMAVDKNGNLYTLSASRYTSYLNGQPIVGNSSDDMLVSSFDCEGNYRWHKVIGKSLGETGWTMRTDTLGGIYLSGRIDADFQMVHIGTDTIIPSGTKKRMILIKYDTSGNFQWLRMPQSDTISSGSHSSFTGFFEMDVAPNGEVYCYSLLAPGDFCNGSYVVDDYGVHVLKYNSSGNFITGTQLDITGSGGGTPANDWANTQFAHFERNHQTGKYYIAGNYHSEWASMYIGNTIIANAIYLGCFDENGNALWAKQNTNPGASSAFINDRPAYDNQGNIYIIGRAWADNNSWGGHDFINSFGISTVPFVIAMDSNGNNIWATNASATGATGGDGGIVVQNNEVIISARYGGDFEWDGLQRNSWYYTPFIAGFNKYTGALNKIDTLAAAGNGPAASSKGLVADYKGNLYLAGRTDNFVVVTGDTIYHAGGSSTWFVAKYGYDNCHCEPALADFEMARTTGNEIIGFSYTGEPATLVEWDFGDGSAIATGNNVNHTYAAGGAYTVCVTAYSDCGTNTYCETIQVGGADVADHPELAALSLYPNPASDALHIHGIQSNLSYQIYTALGRVALRGDLQPGSATIQTGNLTSGLYTLALKHESGLQKRMKVVIEQ